MFTRAGLCAGLFGLFLFSAVTAQNGSVKYVDVTAAAGLTARNVCGDPLRKNYTLEVTGNGCAFFDFDRDGFLDILLVSGSTIEGFRKGGHFLCVLYRNDGKGQFKDVTSAAGLLRRGWGMGVSVADIDNDGWEDVYITGFGSNVLYRNSRNGTFIDFTARAGVGDEGWSTGSAFGDFDRDGFVDLFVTHYVKLDLQNLQKHGSAPICRYRGIAVHCGPKGLPGDVDRLYRNNGDGTFTDVSVKAGIARDNHFYGFTVLWTDYNDDGWPDIFVANDSTPNFLYRNNKDGTFTDVGLLTGVAVSEDGREQACMGADFGDFDGDGRLDLFVTNFSDDYYTLYRHEPGDSFRDISTASGIGTATWNYLGWGTGFLDYDNDGRLDIFCANGHIYPEVDSYDFGTRYRQRNQLLRNMGNGKFEDVQAGPALRIEKSSRGAAFGDYDNDGDTDILVVNINDVPTLMQNSGGNRNHWIGFLTEGTRGNRSGIGARIRAKIGTQIWTGEVRSGGSYISQNDRRILFGLGGASRIESLDIRWPDGETQQFENLVVDKYYLLKQGNPPVPR